ncbi:MAG: RloB domain-containing protein [Lewinellaceae bacterium]|nr:RloB domain-containing protein [Lewinellaceae bacterium]
MARKAKVPNHVKKRLERKAKRRRVEVLPQRQYFLIICEGAKTEPNYFESFKNDLPKGVLENVNIDIDGTGKNTLSLIEETIKHRANREKSLGRQYGQTWAVFDRDSFPPQNFNNAIFKARDA